MTLLAQKLGSRITNITHSHATNTPLRSDPGHELVRCVSTIFHASSKLDRDRDFSERPVHPEKDLAQLSRCVEDWEGMRLVGVSTLVSEQCIGM